MQFPFDLLGNRAAGSTNASGTTWLLARHVSRLSRALTLLAVLAWTAWGHAADAGLPAALPVTPGPVTATTAAAKEYLSGMVLVTSLFDYHSKNGKDPFFPNSERVSGRNVETNQPAVLALPEFELKGISVTVTGGRMAMINRYTLAEGEQAEIRVGDRIYQVRLVEVRENSAVISSRGQQRELFLKAGL